MIVSVDVGMTETIIILLIEKEICVGEYYFRSLNFS